MIRLIVDGECKECPWRDVYFVELYDGSAIARCKHESVCKFIEAENGKKKQRIVDTTLHNKTP